MTTTWSRRIRGSLACALGAMSAVVLAATPAGAHLSQPTNGLSDGFLHPLLGADHLLAMVAVGIVSACGAVRFRWWLAPAAFLTGMVLGGAAGLAGWGMPQAEILILASVLALGLVIAGAVGTSGPWLLPVLLLAGTAHGNAHGLEAPTSAHPLLYIGGFIAATVLLHAAGAVGGYAVRNHTYTRKMLGVATTAAGVLLLAS